MTTATERTAQRATAERDAWRAYAASLLDLDGPAYDEAEQRSWEGLQRRLEEIASRETPPAG